MTVAMTLSWAAMHLKSFVYNSITKRIRYVVAPQSAPCSTPPPPPPPTPPGHEAELALKLMLDHMELSSELDSPLLAHDDMYSPSSMSYLEHSTAIPSDPPWNESDQDALPSEILPSKYDVTDIETIIHHCTYLCLQQQDDLLDVLSCFPKLFNNELNVYPHEKIHLNIDPTVPTHITCAYPVPRSQLQLFKDELDRLVSIGVLKPGGRLEWISGTFTTPKKDSCVCWVSDFCALNKAIKRKVYPIPCIQDILSRRNGYKFLSNSTSPCSTIPSSWTTKAKNFAL